MNFIYQKKNGLCSKSCKKIIDLFEKSIHLQKPGSTTLGEDHSWKKSTDIGISPEALKDLEWGPLVLEIIDALNLSVSEYKNKFTVENSGINTISRWALEENFNIQRYLPEEGYYIYHCENSGVEHSPRMLAWMIYLNTVGDGGGTKFLFQNKITQAEEGKVLIWPADWTYHHKGIVSSTEIKYIITGWYRYY